MQIRIADYSDLKDVKKLYRKAFPAAERKPFFMILEKARTGESEILVFSQEGRFAGFAVTLLTADLVLVDYFAVSESRRGAGLGSEALKMLFGRYSGKRVMLLAEEENAKARNQAQRVKRIRFYLKNSMSDTGVKVSIFGNRFRLLSYPRKVKAEDYIELNARTMGEMFIKLTLTRAC